MNELYMGFYDGYMQKVAVGETPAKLHTPEEKKWAEKQIVEQLKAQGLEGTWSAADEPLKEAARNNLIDAWTNGALNFDSTSGQWSLKPEMMMGGGALGGAGLGAAVGGMMGGGSGALLGGTFGAVAGLVLGYFADKLGWGKDKIQGFIARHQAGDAAGAAKDMATAVSTHPNIGAPAKLPQAPTAESVAPTNKMVGGKLVRPAQPPVAAAPTAKDMVATASQEMAQNQFGPSNVPASYPGNIQEPVPPPAAAAPVPAAASAAPTPVPVKAPAPAAKSPYPSPAGGGWAPAAASTAADKQQQLVQLRQSLGIPATVV